MIDKARFSFSADQTSKLRNEVVILKDLSHPGIVRLLGSILQTSISAEKFWKNYHFCMTVQIHLKMKVFSALIDTTLFFVMALHKKHYVK
jgi:serine/threonine protein kinase